MRTEAFGFAETFQGSSSRQHSAMSLKNAYLLFYDRVYFQNEQEDERTEGKIEEKKISGQNQRGEQNHLDSRMELMENRLYSMEPLIENSRNLENIDEFRKRKQSEMIMMRDICLDEKKISKELKYQIAENNQNYFLNNIFFSNDFMEYYSSTLIQATKTYYIDDESRKIEILRMYLAFFLNIVLRAKDKTVFESLFGEVKDYLISVS
jgi:hypothetical protein